MKYAKNLEGEKISINNANRKTNYYCLICNSPVVVKQGSVMKWHYSHLQGTGEDCELKYQELIMKQNKTKENRIVINNNVNYSIKLKKEIDISTFNDQQKKVWEMIMLWLNDDEDKQFVLSGYAGVGKTYIISKLREYLIQNDIRFNMMSFTGKAVEVLRGKGIREAETIHSTIYLPITNNKGDVIGWELSGNFLRDIVIVDEYSMLNKTIIEDLRKFNKKILYCGDHFQLPPVLANDNGLKESTNYYLTQIVRQAQDNPIIKYATKLRNGEGLDYCYEDNEEGLFAVIRKNHKVIDRLKSEYNQILCGTNKLRNKLNQEIRRMKGFRGVLPNPEEKLICLRNNKNSGVYNGQIFINKFFNWKNEFQLEGHKISEATFDDGYKRYVSTEMFYNPNYKIERIFTKNKNMIKIANSVSFFDFAYAITAHKSQGSEFDTGLIFGYDGKWMKDKYNQWLYTAITRCKKKCVVIL